MGLGGPWIPRCLPFTSRILPPTHSHTLTSTHQNQVEIECAKMSALVSTMLPEGACVCPCASASPFLPPRPSLSPRSPHVTSHQPQSTSISESEDSSEVQEIPLPNVKNNVLAKVRPCFGMVS